MSRGFLLKQYRFIAAKENKWLLKNRLRNRPYVCVKCGAREKLTIDHIVPKALGGDNLPSNLQYLCRPCHDKKDEPLIREWKEKQKRKQPKYANFKKTMNSFNSSAELNRK